MTLYKKDDFVWDGWHLTVESRGDKELYEESGLLDSTTFCVYFGKDELNTKTEIGSFTLTPLAGCCGAVVSSNTYLKQEYRRDPFSGAFREVKDELCKKFGYSLVIMTTQMKNIPAVKNMFNRGFTVATTFENKRTGNLLALGFKEIT